MTTTLRGCILVVDDDSRNRKLLDTLLRTDDYAVRCVENGAAALATVAVERPDAILLDLLMPGMDGFEVVRHLKADPATRSIPVIMITALDDEASRVRLAASGIDNFITKPVDRWQLKACLEKLLVGRES